MLAVTENPVHFVKMKLKMERVKKGNLDFDLTLS